MNKRMKTTLKAHIHITVECKRMGPIITDVATSNSHTEREDHYKTNFSAPSKNNIPCKFNLISNELMKQKHVVKQYTWFPHF